MCISGIYAFTNADILSIKNDINTGAVSIELQEYTISDGKEVLYNDGDEQSVVPGQVISLIPRITNSGDSSYIRAKLSYTSDNNNAKNVAESYIDNSDKNWEKHGEYWYYKKMLEPGEKIDIFKNLTIPNDISNEYQGKILQLNIVVEAIQSENFNPNFNSDSPWNGINAEKATVNSYKMDKIQMSSNVKIEYENRAELYMNVPDNFFSKLGHILPGDVITQEVKINNTTSDEVEYFVSTKKADGLSVEENELLEKLNLNISVDDKTIYDGKVYDLDKVSIGKYKSKASQSIKFTITVSSELGNDYTNLNASMNWKFAVSAKEKVKPPKISVPSPQTGDLKTQIAFGLFFTSAIGLIIILFVERRNKKINTTKR